MVGGGSRALYQGMAPIDVHYDNPYCSPLLKYVSSLIKIPTFTNWRMLKAVSGNTTCRSIVASPMLVDH
jgi:hypothetical protein